MEVNRGLLERSLHFRVQVECGLDHHWNKFLHVRLVSREVLVQESAEDSEERLLFWELDGTEEEVTLQTRVDHEGTGSWVHSGNIHGALNFLNSELGSVIPMLVVLVLTDKGDGTLSIILIESGHVEIINEVDELVLADGSVDLTSSTLELLLKNGLEKQRVSVEIEINDLLEVLISLGGQIVKKTLNDLSLTATS